MTVDEIRNALMKYRPGELAGKTDAAFSRAVQYAVSILANEKREEYKNFIKTAECCDIKNCKDCPSRHEGLCREITMEKLADGLEKGLAEVKCLKDRIRELETQHRTEMCEAGYDCVQLGKERKKVAAAEARAEKAEKYLDEIKIYLGLGKNEKAYELLQEWLVYMYKEIIENRTGDNK